MDETTRQLLIRNMLELAKLYYQTGYDHDGGRWMRRAAEEMENS